MSFFLNRVIIDFFSHIKLSTKKVEKIQRFKNKIKTIFTMFCGVRTAKRI